MTMLRSVLALSLLAIPLAGAPLFGPGDVVIAGTTSAAGTAGMVRVYDAAGNLQSELPVGVPGELRFAPGGLLGVLIGDEVLFIDANGSIVKRIVVPRRFGIGSPDWITFDRDGGFLVADIFRVLNFSPDGAPGPVAFPVDPASVPPPFITGLDLSPNPCILFASDEHIAVVDLCSSSASFPATRILPVAGWSVRLLPDGTFVTSTGGSPYRVERYRPDGSFIRRYAPSGRLLAIDADPRFAWVEIQSGVVQKIDLDMNMLVGGPIVTGFTQIRGLAPVGEWRAAIDGPQPIPTLSEWVLLALAIMLGALALRQLA